MSVSSCYNSDTDDSDHEAHPTNMDQCVKVGDYFDRTRKRFDQSIEMFLNYHMLKLASSSKITSKTAI